MVYTNFTITITQTSTGTNQFYTALNPYIGSGNFFIVKNLVVSSEILTGSGILFDFGISATNSGNPDLYGRYIAPQTALDNNEMIDLTPNISGMSLKSTDYFYVNLNTNDTNIFKIIVSGLLLPITHPFYGTEYNFSTSTASRLTIPGNSYEEVIFSPITNVLIKSIFLTNDDENTPLDIGLFIESGSTKYLVSTGTFEGKGTLLLGGINNVIMTPTNNLYLGSLSSTTLNVTYSGIVNEVS